MAFNSKYNISSDLAKKINCELGLLYRSSACKDKIRKNSSANNNLPEQITEMYCV